MKNTESQKPSKVYLISQESPFETGIHPVQKEYLFEYRGGTRIDTDAVSPLAFPVGYVIEHDDFGVHEMHSDSFEVLNKVVAYPIYTGVDMSHLEGQLLTIIDAAFADDQQRESVKSLVRNTVWGFHSKQEKKVQAMYQSLNQ